jgi:hypothetical protein
LNLLVFLESIEGFLHEVTLVPLGCEVDCLSVLDLQFETMEGPFCQYIALLSGVVSYFQLLVESLHPLAEYFVHHIMLSLLDHCGFSFFHTILVFGKTFPGDECAYCYHAVKIYAHSETFILGSLYSKS